MLFYCSKEKTDTSCPHKEQERSVKFSYNVQLQIRETSFNYEDSFSATGLLIVMSSTNLDGGSGKYVILLSLYQILCTCRRLHNVNKSIATNHGPFVHVEVLAEPGSGKVSSGWEWDCR